MEHVAEPVFGTKSPVPFVPAGLVVDSKSYAGIAKW